MPFPSISHLVIRLIVPAIFFPVIFPISRATRINCGSSIRTSINGLEFLPDANFTTAGTPRAVSFVELPSPLLFTVRSFPLAINKKFCYVVPTIRSTNYLVRTTYYYGAVNGPKFPSPPVFDQIIDGTIWRLVNTIDDYRRNKSTYYEGVFMSKGKSMSVCVGTNNLTESDPFISALEVVMLPYSVYNSTDFTKYGLSLVTRSNFGYNGSSIRYPDDQFDRIWEPFEGTLTGSKSTNSNAIVSGIWNLPPLKVFATEMTSSSVPLTINWPPSPLPLPNSSYYMAFYFATNGSFIPVRQPVFDIIVNNVAFYRNLHVTEEGLAVFSGNWSLGGNTTISLIPAAGSSAASFNAGELFTVLSLGRRTLVRDVLALENIRNNISNPPLDWSGDPCVPQQYSWTGVLCSEGKRVRVVTLNLTGMELAGSLSPSIARLTALTDIWLANNKFSGSIPELKPLKQLKRLHLENNQLTGSIPSSLGDNKRLTELFLQNNNLSGHIPSSLSAKKGLDLRTSGNPLLNPSP